MKAPQRGPSAERCTPPAFATVSRSRRGVQYRTVLRPCSSKSRSNTSRPAGASVHAVGAAALHGHPGRRPHASPTRPRPSGRGGTGQIPPGEMSWCPGDALRRSSTQRRSLPPCSVNFRAVYRSSRPVRPEVPKSESSINASNKGVGTLWCSLHVKSPFSPLVRPVCMPDRGSLWNVHLKAVIARCGAQPIGHAGQFVHVRNGGAFGICITLPVQAQPDPASGVGHGSSRARRRIPGRTLSHRGALPGGGFGRRGRQNACGEQARCERGNSRRDHQEAGAGGVGGATPPDTRTRQCTTRPEHRACAKRLFGRVTTSRSEEPLGSFADVLAHVSGAQDRPARPAATARPLAFVLASRPPESSGRTA